MNKLIQILENGLVYIGYGLGLVLLFENIAKIYSNPRNSEIGVKMLVFSLVLWFVSYLSRKFVFGSNHEINSLRSFARIKLEILYFLFCHTFTVLFVSTMLKYTPVTFVQSQQELTNYETYSGLLSYVTREFAFLLIANMFLIFMFITFLLFASKFLYIFALGKFGYFSGDQSKMSTVRIMTLALLIVFSLVLMQIPFFSKSITSLHGNLNLYLKTHFQWLADYALGSPLFYYVYASFKGSALAEKFSAYRRFI